MPIISKMFFVIVSMILSITVSGFSEDQFKVEIKCDKQVYYSRDLPDITVSLENKGNAANIDLYIAYTNPLGLMFFSDIVQWNIYPEPGAIDSKPIKYFSHIEIPEGFKLPQVSISGFFHKQAFPNLDISFSPYTANPFLFGNYTFYMAVCDSQTNELLSNISSYQIEFRKLPEKDWGSIPFIWINKLALDKNTIWCANSGGICILDTKTDSFEYHARYGGLIDGTVREITVDSKGRKWFLNYGVTFFDGENWQNFNCKTGDFNYGYRNAELYCIVTDYNDRVLVGLENGVTFVNDGTSWTQYNLPGYVYGIHVITPSEDGSIWFGTSKGLFILDGENWEYYHTKNSSIPGDQINAIAIDATGSAWIGMANNVVASFDGTTFTKYDQSNSTLPDSWITSIAIDQENRKWFGTSPGGVSVFDDITWLTYTKENSGLASDDVNDIMVDHEGKIWLATGNSISMFDGTNWKIYKMTNTSNDLKDSDYIAIDSKGKKWIAGAGRTLSSFDGENWTNYNSRNSPLLDSPIGKIAVDKNDRIWLAYSKVNNGATMFDGENWHVYNSTTTPGFNGDKVFAFSSDLEGRVWVGSISGLFIFDGTKWTSLDTPDQELSKNMVLTIDFDSKGNAWIGTNSKGIFVYDEQNWTNYSDTSNNGYIGGNAVPVIYIDNLDRKWISCESYNNPNASSGVLLFDDKEWINYNRSNSHIYEWTPPSVITSDSRGNMYFGDPYGLTVFDGINWITYDVFNSELLSNNVESIAIDKDGKKWIGSPNGISILDDIE
jgi:ligand-binding sensor domain-containing protein